VGSRAAAGALIAVLLACAAVSVRGLDRAGGASEVVVGTRQVSGATAGRRAAQAAAPGAPPSYVAFRPAPGAFTLAAAGTSAPIVVGASDWPGVLRAARSVATDVGRVTGRASAVSKPS